MAQKGSRKGKGKETARAKMLTLVLNQRLSLHQDRIKGFISENCLGLIPMYNVCGVKDERAWDLFYDIIFLHPVPTLHFSHFQLRLLHRVRRSSPFQQWWADFRRYMGQMYDKTWDQMNIWRWNYPCAFGDQVDHFNPHTTSLEMFKPTGEHFSWYGSDDPRAKIEPPRCQQ